jgi:hypothetical protein
MTQLFYARARVIKPGHPYFGQFASISRLTTRAEAQRAADKASPAIFADVTVESISE